MAIQGSLSQFSGSSPFSGFADRQKKSAADRQASQAVLAKYKDKLDKADSAVDKNTTGGFSAKDLAKAVALLPKEVVQGTARAGGEVGASVGSLAGRGVNNVRGKPTPDVSFDPNKLAFVTGGEPITPLQQQAVQTAESHPGGFQAGPAHLSPTQTGIALLLSKGLLDATAVKGGVKVSDIADREVSQAVSGPGQALNIAKVKSVLGNLPPEPITDPSRLLPEAGTSMRRRISEIDSQLSDINKGNVQNTKEVPQLGTMQGSKNTIISKGDVPLAERYTQMLDNKTKVRATGEARALVNEKKTLQDELDNLGASDSHIVNQVAQVDEHLSKAKTPEDAAALASTRESLVGEISQTGSKKAKSDVQALTDVSKMANKSDIPMLSQKTEARAVNKGLTKGFEDLPTDPKDPFGPQRAAANDLAKSNYEQAKAIAMGAEPPPPGIRAGAFYKAVENEATLKGDIDTIHELSVNSRIPQQVREAGREIGILGVKDPDSPVEAIKEINTLRQASKDVKIPKSVTQTESLNIVNLAREAERQKQKFLDSGGALDSAGRLEYGRAKTAFRNYVSALKLNATKKSFKEQLKSPGELFMKGAGNAKALQSSMDNSSLFRQGWKSLWTHPGKWSKNALKSFQDIAKTFGGKNVLDETAADISSRPNELNGFYKKAKLAVGIDEEAYPEHLGYKLPLLGRAYKASEAAFVGFLQRQRADIFDKYIDMAQKSGVELTDKELASIGKLVNGLTSRGSLGKYESAGNLLNNIFFSPRLLKSHFEVLGGHVITGAGGSNFVRKQAAKNLVKIVSGTAAVLALADAVRPGSVEWDPRSSDFGKIKIGNTRFDVSGGMGSVATLASRLVTLSKKSSTTGDVSPLTGQGFGAATGLDVVENFFENKLSPVAGVARDILRGETFQGDKPTPARIAGSLITPLIFQNLSQLKGPGSANSVAAGISEALGVSANTYSASPNWKTSGSAELKAFKEKVGDEKFSQATKNFDNKFDTWLRGIEKTPKYQALSVDDRQTVRNNKSEEIKKKILEGYNFEYEPPKKDKDRLKGF